MTSSLPPLAQAWSGALGSATANAISYPLDLVATKLQTTTSKKIRGLRGAVRLIKHVMHTEGLTGLYDGLGADTASTITSNFLYFYFYTLLHALVARRKTASRVSLSQTLKHAIASATPPTLLSVPAELGVGFIAGVASRAISTPLSVVTVRMQTGDGEDDNGDNGDQIGDEQTSSPSQKENGSPQKRSPGFCGTIESIYAEEGILGFWAGFRPTLPLCLTPALTLLLFQLLSRLRIPGRRSAPRRSSDFGAFFSGALANAFAVAILYPLLLAKVRVQASHKHVGTNRSVSVIDIWNTAIKDEGWAGLYQGITVQLVKGFVNQGVTMLVKQRIEHAAIKLYT
ncbi:mitochondrial carrier [Trametes maxima]|nr:mitochondrial carrier [Trametes maxima]